MVDDENILFRPVDHGYYPATALLDGSIDLEFVMKCNHALDVRFENEHRAHEAAKAAAQARASTPGR